MLIRKRKKTPPDLSGIRGNFPKCEANIFLAVLASQRPRGPGDAPFHRSYLDPVTPRPGFGVSLSLPAGSSVLSILPPAPPGLTAEGHLLEQEPDAQPSRPAGRGSSPW